MSNIKCNGRIYESYHKIDFIDIGANKGGSYRHIKKKFHYENGLAIDIDIRKVKESLQNNVPAIRLDATQMNIFNDNACELISIMHTLEHLPNIEVVKHVLKECVRVASKTVYITGPMFYQDYLSNKGLQFFWTNWTGHTCLIEPDSIISIMKELGKTDYTLNFHEKHKVLNCNNPCIHPINGLADRHDYDITIDPPKETNICFEKDIYKEFELIFTL